jgi:hypothetical protein
VLQLRPMTVLLAVLISGVLLDANDQPMPKYQLAFTSADGKLIKAITNKDGKFRVNLAPGTYRFQFGLITVDKNTSTLKLHEPPPVIEAPKPPEPHIEVILGTQRDLLLGPRG